MKRRSFLHSGSMAGIALVFFNCNQEPVKDGPVSDIKSKNAFLLDEVTVTELQSKMASGELSSRRITEMYLQRIAEIDRKGFKLNSIIELNPDALKIADMMDEERKSNKHRGPMHGIPILIKDNINTADQMQTTAGSLALSGHKAQKDAGLVKKLRAGGAVIIGKTNLSEWANFRSTRSSSGWSSRGGQTKNPYVLDCSPCGSSSGSGTAVAANLCAVAIGTETDGSISCPSSINGIVGIKPTVGLVSRAGIIPISKTQDTAGPMTRTVTDAAILLGVIAGADPDDEATKQIEGQAVPDYTKFLDKSGLSGKRIGYDQSIKKHEAVDALTANAFEQLKKAGATMVPVDFSKENNKLGDAEFEVLQYEFKDGLNKYLAAENVSVKNLEEIINFNKSHDSTAMPFFKQELLTMCQEKGDLNSKQYTDALKKLISGRNFIADLLEKNKLDALCTPANGASWSIDLVNGDGFTGYGGYSFAAKTGFPSITVPMGMVKGLPVGLCFFSKAFDEGNLISIAYAYEQISKNRKPPDFIESINA